MNLIFSAAIWNGHLDDVPAPTCSPPLRGGGSPQHPTRVVLQLLAMIKQQKASLATVPESITSSLLGSLWPVAPAFPWSDRSGRSENVSTSPFTNDQGATQWRVSRVCYEEANQISMRKFHKRELPASGPGRNRPPISACCPRTSRTKLPGRFAPTVCKQQNSNQFLIRWRCPEPTPGPANQKIIRLAKSAPIPKGPLWEHS